MHTNYVDLYVEIIRVET